MKRLILFLAVFSLTCTSFAQETASLEDMLYLIIQDDGVEAAVETYKKLQQTQTGTYDFGPSSLNRLGYRLINEEQFDDAIRIFHLNVETHPHVANGYDSLAEAYLWRGDYDQAVEAYMKLKEVAPRDSVASRELRAQLTKRASYVIETYHHINEPVEEVLSPRIQRLAVEVQQNGAAAVQAFKEERKAAGGPLVELIEGDPAYRLVTFVWFEEEARDHVVIESWLESRSIEKRMMRKLTGTPLWYKTYRVPTGLRMGYTLSPNDRRLSPFASLLTGNMRQSTWTLDPLNPKSERGEGNRMWSVLELPDASSAHWLDSEMKIPEEQLSNFEMESTHLGEPWDVVVYRPPGFSESSQERYPLLVFFDAFGFVNVDRTHVLLDSMIARGEVPPVVAAFVYNPGSTRSRDMSCYAPTHAFLKEDLIPRLRRDFRSGLEPAETVIVGRSRSGLGAACAAYHLPEIFGNVIAQSGSFWWGPEGEEMEWLARTMAKSPPRPITFYLEAGLLEDDPNPATGLSMLTVTRHLRDVAIAKGYQVHYQEFAGGHDLTAWRTTLPRAFATLLGVSE